MAIWRVHDHTVHQICCFFDPPYDAEASRIDIRSHAVNVCRTVAYHM